MQVGGKWAAAWRQPVSSSNNQTTVLLLAPCLGERETDVHMNTLYAGAQQQPWDSQKADPTSAPGDGWIDLVQQSRAGECHWAVKEGVSHTTQMSLTKTS